MTYLTDALADRAVDFIRREKARPFLLYLAFNAVHTPMQATDKYLARFKHITDPQRRTYAAMLSAMDDAIGRTIAAIRDEGLEENTLVIFFSDNGGPTMLGTTINGSSNATAQRIEAPDVGRRHPRALHHSLERTRSGRKDRCATDHPARRAADGARRRGHSTWKPIER